MQIYIASSWKNQHGVEMLTKLLRINGHDVVSWVENNFGENHGPDAGNFSEWVKSEAAQRSFAFDVNGAILSDLVIYLSPGGTDAWAELGAAFGANVPIMGLWAKGEPSGLMRYMVSHWCQRYTELLGEVEKLQMDMDNGIQHNNGFSQLEPQ